MPPRRTLKEKKKDEEEPPELPPTDAATPSANKDTLRKTFQFRKKGKSTGATAAATTDTDPPPPPNLPHPHHRHHHHHKKHGGHKTHGKKLSKDADAVAQSGGPTKEQENEAPVKKKDSIISLKDEKEPDEPMSIVSLFSNAGRDIEIVRSGSVLNDKQPEPVKEDTDIRNRNTWSVETFEATTERVFQGKYLEALRPYIRTLICLGRFPLSAFMKDVVDANPYYQIRWASARAIWCIVVSSANFLLCLWSWIACLLFFANLVHTSENNQIYWKYLRSHEMILIKRNMTTFVMFHMCLVHIFLTHLLIFTKRNFNCKYSTLWLESVELLRLHCVNGIRRFFWWHLGLFILSTLSVVGLFSSSYFHICEGTGAMIGMLLLRIFAPKVVIWDAKHFYAVRVFGMIVFVYVFMLAKFSAIQFAVRCHLINKLVEVWNRRFRVCLHGTEKEQKGMIRSTRAYLFKDHCVWVNILEGANKEIFLQIESFFVMVCVSIVYELHHIVRAWTGNEFDWNRKLDFYPCLCFLIIDLYYFYAAGIEAGLLIETVGESYDIVREKGVLSRKVDQEVTFMMSLQLSLMGSTDEKGMGLVGFEFVYYSKTFMLVAIGFSVSFFVMLWQYQQPLDQYIGNDPICDRVNVRSFLDRVMNLRMHFPKEKTHLSSCQREYRVYYDE